MGFRLTCGLLNWCAGGVWTGFRFFWGVVGVAFSGFSCCFWLRVLFGGFPGFGLCVVCRLAVIWWVYCCRFVLVSFYGFAWAIAVCGFAVVVD